MVTDFLKRSCTNLVYISSFQATCNFANVVFRIFNQLIHIVVKPAYLTRCGFLENGPYFSVMNFNRYLLQHKCHFPSTSLCHVCRLLTFLDDFEACAHHIALGPRLNLQSRFSFDNSLLYTISHHSIWNVEGEIFLHFKVRNKFLYLLLIYPYYFSFSMLQPFI